MNGLFLLAGLGNPDIKYVNTRHNIGFMVIDQLSQRFNRSFLKGGTRFWWCEIDYLQKHVILIKPNTYMNLSGLAVQEAIDIFKVEFPQLLIILDDFNLPFGKLRLRAKGSDGGHRGQASIIYHLQTQNFPRLRIGIGTPVDQTEMVDYVLAPFSAEEQKQLPEIINDAVEACLFFVNNGITAAMNHFN